MAEFTYTGIDKTGKRVGGKLTAASEGDLRMLLRGMGVRPTKIARPTLAGKNSPASFFKGSDSVSTESLVIFTRQLNVLIGSGIPLVQALEILSEQSADRTLK